METIAVNDDKKARMSEIFGQVFYYDDDINKMFNKKNYQPSFDKLYEMIEPALEILNGLYISSDEKEKEQLIIPNPANLCCGTGLCGSCSHTDKDGLTVRLCKCSPVVIE